MDLHSKAYHLNYWLLSLYAFKYPQCCVTLLSQGWNLYFGVYSDLNLVLHGTSFLDYMVGSFKSFYKLFLNFRKSYKTWPRKPRPWRTQLLVCTSGVCKFIFVVRSKPPSTQLKHVFSPYQHSFVNVSEVSQFFLLLLFIRSFWVNLFQSIFTIMVFLQLLMVVGEMEVKLGSLPMGLSFCTIESQLDALCCHSKTQNILIYILICDHVLLQHHPPYLHFLI